MAWPAQIRVNTARAAAAPSAASVTGRGARPAAATAMPQTTSTARHCPSSSRPSWVSNSGSSDGARTMARSLRVTVAMPDRGEQPAEPQQRHAAAGQTGAQDDGQMPAAPSSTARPRVQHPPAGGGGGREPGRRAHELAERRDRADVGDAHAERVGARREVPVEGGDRLPVHRVDAVGQWLGSDDPQLLLVAGNGGGTRHAGRRLTPGVDDQDLRQRRVDRLAEGEQDCPGERATVASTAGSAAISRAWAAAPGARRESHRPATSATTAPALAHPWP